jgi:N-acetylneuraminic acid mutarotase
VAGGLISALKATSTAELYDPATGTWTPTGWLNYDRGAHTATLLSNGKVLVVGGLGGDIIALPLKSAEIYDPAEETWTVVGSLSEERFFYTATLLPIGQVLAAGGLNSLASTVTNTAELYDPSRETWTGTGLLNNARGSHTATLLPNGLVLAAGGFPTKIATSAELYNPATGSWTATGLLNTGRDKYTATLLPNGQVLAAGGENEGGGAMNSAELYNPARGSWTATGLLNSARKYHTATRLGTGQVLVAGGENADGALNGAELYQPQTYVPASSLLLLSD